MKTDRWPWIAFSLLAAVVSSTACSTDDTVVATSFCCPLDPANPPRAIRGCRNALDCPSGLTCASSTTDIVCNSGECCLGDAPYDSLCRLPTESHVDVLIDGFGVGAVNLAHSTDPSLLYDTFVFTVPGAVVTKCALFGCLPVIEGGVIANYEQCALADQQESGESNFFDLGEAMQLTPSAPANQCPASSPSPSAALPRTITEFTVGCWAYDNVGLTKTTQLAHVDPKRTPLFQALTLSTCENAAGSACLFPDGSFGSCSAGACGRRCIDAGDCADAVRAGLLERRTWACARDPEVGYVGVCRPPS